MQNESGVKERIKKFIAYLNISEEEKARLLSIIESQQRTIEMLAEQNKKAAAQPESNAGCAAAV